MIILIIQDHLLDIFFGVHTQHFLHVVFRHVVLVLLVKKHLLENFVVQLHLEVADRFGGVTDFLGFNRIVI